MSKKNGKSTVLREEETVERFSLNFRIQHILLFLSMVVLSVTGLSLRFHQSWIGKLLIQLEGGMEMRGLIHRWAAVVLMALGIYHFLYVFFTEKGHQEFMLLKPRLKDFVDFYQVIKFTLGMSNHYPDFDKYDFREKFQYGGVVFGALIMAFTGFILWFETASMAVMPKWMIDVTLIVHGYEGLLAFLVLLLWHLYSVHLNPEVFPMDWSWLTGRITYQELKARHFLQYLRIVKGDEKV